MKEKVHLDNLTPNDLGRIHHTLPHPILVYIDKSPFPRLSHLYDMAHNFLQIHRSVHIHLRSAPCPIVRKQLTESDLEERP
jgi:hypothetical protein